MNTNTAVNNVKYINVNYSKYEKRKLVCFNHRSNRPSRYAITNYYDFVIGIYNWFIIFQRNSFIEIAICHSVKKKKHPSQWLGNPFKINLFSVYRNSIGSDKALVCNQLSRSECKPTRECLFHSFIIGEHAVLENLFVHCAIYTKTNKFH